YFEERVPCFPAELIEALVAEADLPGVLGRRHANGMEIIRDHGAEHMRSGAPIVYTSADSVFQIAAHEGTFGLDRLYALCEIARRLCDPYRIGRVIARPFVGAGPDDFVRTANRRDYATPPHLPTLCDRARAAGREVIGIGKIGDIFAHRGVSRVLKGADDMALFDATLGTLDKAPDGAPDGALIFANFVEFDSLYGHPRDVAGYARALEAFDARLPEALAKLRRGDLMILTADHGNDPSWSGNDHTREQVPILCAGPEVASGGRGVRAFADVGATAAKRLGVDPGPYGEAFL
ncbi:MAG: phosphopentomutase, partial [Pseudomonadota bacterium]